MGLQQVVARQEIDFLDIPSVLEKVMDKASAGSLPSNIVKKHVHLESPFNLLCWWRFINWVCRAYKWIQEVFKDD